MSDSKASLDKELISLIKNAKKSLSTVNLPIYINSIRLNSRKEVFNTNIVSYYRDNGITLEVTPARILEINGVTKRINKIIITKTRIILINAKLPTTY